MVFYSSWTLACIHILCSAILFDWLNYKLASNHYCYRSRLVSICPVQLYYMICSTVNLLLPIIIIDLAGHHPTPSGQMPHKCSPTVLFVHVNGSFHLALVGAITSRCPKEIDTQRGKSIVDCSIILSGYLGSDIPTAVFCSAAPPPVFTNTILSIA